MKKIISLSTALICMLSVSTGCGSKKSDYVGKWQCEAFEFNGEKSDNAYGAPANTLFQIVLDENNTGTCYISLLSGMLNNDEPFDIKWEKKDKNSIDFKFTDQVGMNEEEAVFNLEKDGEKLVLTAPDEPDTKYYLVSVDEFAPHEDFTMDIKADINASASFDASGDDVKVEVNTK